MTRYFYLLGSLYFVIITIWMYIKMPRYRRAMTILGLSVFWLGPIAEYLWFTKDWWHPQTITNTVIGPEDFILSFTNFVIAVFIYKLVFKRDADGEFKLTSDSVKTGIIRIIFWLIVPLILVGILFQLFHLSSVISIAIGMVLSGFIILINRRDLLSEMLWSSLLMVALTIPVYLILEFLLPGSIKEIWYFPKLTGITFLRIPIEDILFYALLGFSMGGAYEYIFGFKLVKR